MDMLWRARKDGLDAAERRLAADADDGLGVAMGWRGSRAMSSSDCSKSVRRER